MNISKGQNFQGMFSECVLTNLYALRNWNVSKGTNFSYIFFYCTSLTQLFALEK